MIDTAISLLREQQSKAEKWSTVWVVADFPPNLRAAHDRAMDGYDGTDGKRYLTGFLKISATWRELEWSDECICAVLPRSNADLQWEGKNSTTASGTTERATWAGS